MSVSFGRCCALPPLPPFPTVEEFRGHFATIFGAFCSGELDPGLASYLAAVDIPPFTVDEVADALASMACHCTSGIASFPADFYRAA